MTHASLRHVLLLLVESWRLLSWMPVFFRVPDFFLRELCVANSFRILSATFFFFTDKYKKHHSFCSGGDRSFIPNSFRVSLVCVLFSALFLRFSRFLARYLEEKFLPNRGCDFTFFFLDDSLEIAFLLSHSANFATPNS